MRVVTPPDVDYSRTSQRPDWSSLPQPVRAAVGRLAGSPVVTADPPVGSGFTGSYAGLVTAASARQVFAKAGSPGQPHVVAALAQEAHVLGLLPAGMPAPTLVGFASVEGWSVLVLEVVPGRMPGAPWTPEQVDAVHRACLTMAEVGTPSTVGGRDFADRIATDPEIVAVAQGWVDGSGDVSPALPGWLTAYRVRVGELVLASPGRFEGDTVCHGDLRPDNLLLDGPAATVVDWNWVGTAAAWVDWVGLLPLMAAQGVDTDALVATSPLTRDADPDALDSYLAAIAAYMVAGFEQPPPPGCTPQLRRHQLLMAHVFLEAVRQRRRWD